MNRCDGLAYCCSSFGRAHCGLDRPGPFVRWAPGPRARPDEYPVGSSPGPQVARLAGLVTPCHDVSERREVSHVRSAMRCVCGVLAGPSGAVPGPGVQVQGDDLAICLVVHHRTAARQIDPGVQALPVVSVPGPRLREVTATLRSDLL